MRTTAAAAGGGLLDQLLRRQKASGCPLRDHHVRRPGGISACRIPGREANFITRRKTARTRARWSHSLSGDSGGHTGCPADRLTGSGRGKKPPDGSRVILRRLPEIIYTAGFWTQMGAGSRLTETKVREAFSLITTSGPPATAEQRRKDGMPNRKKVMVLEDESSIAVIVINLRRAGYEVIEAAPAKALDMLQRQAISVALLDVMLPGSTALVCRHPGPPTPASASSCSPPVHRKWTRSRALMTGADDYVTKPFSPAELTARIDALFRRTRRHGQADTGRSPAPFLLNNCPQPHAGKKRRARQS